MKLAKIGSIMPGRLTLNQFVDDFFNRGVSDLLGADFMISRPSVNIIEREDSYHLELAAPGLEKSDFNISVEGDTLVISAQKSSESTETKELYSRREFNFSSFTRSFNLPKEVLIDKITAEYDHGILKINIPKSKAEQIQAQTRIEVK